MLHHLFSSFQLNKGVNNIYSILLKPLYLYHYCSKTNGNFTRNNTYETNLNRLLSSFLYSTAHENGFYNFSSGQGSNIANAIALYRGDVSSSDYFDCVNNANTELRDRCPDQIEASICSCLSSGIVYISQCYVRKQGVRVGVLSCNIRFGIDRFYNLTAVDTTTTGNNSNSSGATIIISISATAFSLFLISGCIFIILRLRKPKLKPRKHEATEAVNEIITCWVFEQFIRRKYEAHCKT
ncbi:hypothetical protein PVK06_030906 [Gossypium arboreum]|uniref:Gnk2-homologous domain-containing protein n=1 Tax=Gossypium arboreum TaxID=29729 RepID=A0ABR0NPJ9_GOSAR|nr:hypothetical protein PVK06_030906 [Gossypium arboreum]